METLKLIKVPIQIDSIATPDFFYGEEYIGIYFFTAGEKYGRVSFEKLDAVKICRGEYLPYPEPEWALAESWDQFDAEIEISWVFQVENSTWLSERYGYEHKNYGDSYEFNGNVDEMLTHYKHYVFKFHDGFIEVIAAGFWLEEDNADLFKKPFTAGHPFLRLSEKNMQRLEHSSLTAQIRVYTKPEEQLIHDAQYCSQMLYEYALEFDGKASVVDTVVLSYKNGKPTSTLRGYFGNAIAEYEGIASLEQIEPHIKKYMEEVYERRKKNGL